MVSYETVINAIEPPKWKDKDIVEYQDTGDIIKDLIYCFKKYNEQAGPIAKKFSTGNIYSDAKNIHDFIKNNIRYEAEPEKFQTTRSFSRIIHDKHGDCKHSALIASAIAWNLGYNVIFRFVGYNRGESFGHVYTLIQNPKTGRTIVIDPLQKFGEEKYFFKKQDYKAKNNLKFQPMLSRLTGFPQNSNIGAYLDVTEERLIDGLGNREIILTPFVSEDKLSEIEELSGIGRRTRTERKEKRKAAKEVRKEKRGVKKEARQEKREVKKEAKQEKRVVKKEARQEKRAEKKEVRKEKRVERGGSVVKKIALAPVRGAFLGLLLVNARGMATRLKESISKNENEVKKFAAKFGFKYDKLLNAINKGATKKPLFGSKIKGIHQVEGIGAIAISAAALAAAAPAIIAVTALFKTLGIGQHKEAPPGENDESTIKESTDDIQKIVTAPGAGGATDSGGYGGAADSGDKEDAGEGKGSEFMETIKNLPTPVILIGSAGLLFAAGKIFKIF